MVFSALLNLLHDQVTLFSIVALIVSPFLTHYVTTLLFYRRAHSNASRKVPPTIPYYVPWVFHAFSLAYTGPQEHFARLMKDYGDFAPFFVKAGPQPFLVISDLVHVKQVLTASKATTPTAFHLELFDKLYGSPQAALDKYAGRGVSETDKAAIEVAHVGLTQKYLTGVSLSTSVEMYVSILSGNLSDKMFQVGTWTQIEDTWSFLRQVVTRCTMESLFGTDLFKQYPGIVRGYWEFADAVESFIPGLPRYWVPSAASQSRDRLLQGIEEWLKTNHSGSEFARTGAKDPVWDNFKGSKFVQERDDVLAKVQGIDLKARAAEILSIMHESNSNLIPCIFWTLVEVLRRPQLVKQLTTSVTRYSPSQGATYNVHDLTNLPAIDSLLAETVRLRTASIVVHTGSEDLQLDDHWVVPRNIPIVICSYNTLLNTKAWAEARLRTVDKPLHEYWAERFLIPDRTGSKVSQRGQHNDVGGMAFSMESLSSLNIGHGQYRLLGHDYIRTIHAATLAVLLNEFELQLCDPELFDEVVAPSREVAYGILKPHEQIEVRIRKRPLTERR